MPDRGLTSAVATSHSSGCKWAMAQGTQGPARVLALHFQGLRFHLCLRPHSSLASPRLVSRPSSPTKSKLCAAQPLKHSVWKDAEPRSDLALSAGSPFEARYADRTTRASYSRSRHRAEKTEALKNARLQSNANRPTETEFPAKGKISLVSQYGVWEGSRWRAVGADGSRAPWSSGRRRLWTRG